MKSELLQNLKIPPILLLKSLLPFPSNYPHPVGILHNGSVIGIEEIAPLVRTADTDSKASISVHVSPGSRAGLATQVMDQAMLGGAKAVKLTPLLR